MAGRQRAFSPLALALLCALGAGCPSRSPYGGSGGDGGDQPVDDGGTPPPPTDGALPGPPDAAVVQICGDGVCVPAEICACPQDCGDDNCHSECGDGWCQ